MKLGRLAALIVCILVLPIAQLPDIGGVGLSGFGPAADVPEMTIVFPAGGGTNSSINLSLPAGATVTNATMNIQALPQITSGLLDYGTPLKLKNVPVAMNVTTGANGTSLSGFNWSWVQASDADFKTDESENVTVRNGVLFANNFTGGNARDFEINGNIEMYGAPSVWCSPNGSAILSWAEFNVTQGMGMNVTLQRIDSNGNPFGLRISEGASTGPYDWEANRIVANTSNVAMLTWTYFCAGGYSELRYSVYNESGETIVPPSPPTISQPYFLGSNSSVASTSNDIVLVSWVTKPGASLVGRWFFFNGSPAGDEFTIQMYLGDNRDIQSGIVSLSNNNEIVYAATDYNDTFANVYITRVDSNGYEIHPRTIIGSNDTYTSPTSFKVLDDGTTVVAYTATFGSENLSVRCSHVSRGGTILGEYLLANGSEAYLYPSVCKLPDNKFACAWGRKVDNLTYDIQARVFRADGTPEGAVIDIARAVGVNASWELVPRDNDSIALVYRTDNPEPYGQIRYAIIDLERALTGYIESKVLSRPGTVVVDAQVSTGTGYSVDVIDATTKQVLQTGLHNGDPVRSWAPYFLRLHLERDVYNASVAEPVIRIFGVETGVSDLFSDYSMFDSWDNVTIQNGNLTMPSVSANGWAMSRPIELPFRPVSLDNASYWSYRPSGTSITIMLRSRSGVTWSLWEVISPTDNHISTPVGDAYQFMVGMNKGIGPAPTLDWFKLDYSILYKSGFILSAPGNITDGCFTKYKVSWTAQGDSASATLTVDGGMNYFGVSNGLETVNTRAGRALQTMMVLEGDGNNSPLLEGFSASYEARSLPSEIGMEIDGDYKWAPPAGADLEQGVAVRDFAKVLNAITQRTFGPGNITIPLNFTSATAGRLRVWNLRLSMNLPPKLERVRPLDDVIIEENATQVFEVTVSDPDGDTVNLTWEVDGDIVGHGVSILYLADEGTAGCHTVRAIAKDGRFTVVESWNVTVVWIDHNNAPRIMTRFPDSDMDIRETENASFGICATDPDGEILRYSWYLNGDKVSVSDNYTFHSWYDSAGAYVIKVFVTDGIAQNFTSWNLTVRNVNRSPAIKSWLPEKLSVVQRNRELNFSVNATDPDNEPLTYTWMLDGKAVDNNNFSTYNLTFTWADEKTHRVAVVVSDGNMSVSTQWEMRAGRSGTPTDVGFQECGALFVTIAAMFGLSLFLWYRKKKTRPATEQSVENEVPEPKTESKKGPKVNVRAGKTIPKMKSKGE
jgi:hypothetical protein